MAKLVPTDCFHLVYTCRLSIITSACKLEIFIPKFGATCVLFGGPVASALTPWRSEEQSQRRQPALAEQRSWFTCSTHWGKEHRPAAVNLCAEVDLEVLGVVKDVQEGAALIKLGDAEETQRKVRESHKNLELRGRVKAHSNK